MKDGRDACCRHYLDEGFTKSAIAERLGISRKAVTRWIRSGDLDRELDEPPRYRPRPPVPRKLDPYRGDHRGSATGVSEAVVGAAAGRDPGRRL